LWFHVPLGHHALYANLRSQFKFRAVGFWRAVEQRARLNVQDPREFVDHINCCTVYSAFQSTNICAIDPSFVGECFLGQLLVVASLPQVASQDLSYEHAPEANAL
jgi:hypothetical protein